MELKDRIIVLKTIKFKESDLIIRGISGQGKKLNFIAKGAKRSKKRFFGGVLEPTHFIEVVYKDKKTTVDEFEALYFLNEAQLKDDFQALRTDYDKLELAFYFIKTIDKINLVGQEDGIALFNLLGNILKIMTGDVDLDVLKTQFELKVLYHQGVLPPDIGLDEFLNESVLAHEKLRKFKNEDFAELSRYITAHLTAYLH